MTASEHTELLPDRRVVIEECIAEIEAFCNFGDYKRQELTADYGQPKFDLMHDIIRQLRLLADTPVLPDGTEPVPVAWRPLTLDGFGADIRAAMEKSDIAVRQLATEIGVDKSAISRARNGKPITAAHFVTLWNWLHAVPPLALANCCECGRIVDTRETKDGGDPFGAQLDDGRWTCSFECYEKVVPMPVEGRSIADVGFYEIRRQLNYKAAQVVEADRFFPSSKTCSACGSIKQNLKLSDRTFRCECGHEVDRDVNAARNLERMAANCAVSARGAGSPTGKRKFALSSLAAKREANRLSRATRKAGGAMEGGQ